MKNELFLQLKKKRLEYDEKEVRKCIETKDTEKLFNYLWDTNLKNINNFFFLLNGRKTIVVHHTKDDVICELYIILFKCVQKVDLSKTQYFKNYYNKACMQGMYRLIKKTYKIHYEITFEDWICIDKHNSQDISFKTILTHLNKYERILFIVIVKKDEQYLKRYCKRVGFTKQDVTNLKEKIKAIII
jgi:hypothetical protein